MLHKFFHFHFQLAWWNSDTTNISQFQKFFFDGYGVPRITAAFLLSNPARCFFRGPVETLSRSHGCAKEIFFGFLPASPLKRKTCEGGLVFRGEKKDWTSRCFYLKDDDRLTVTRIALILDDFGMFLFVIIMGILKGGYQRCEEPGSSLWYSVRFPFRNPFAVTPFPWTLRKPMR